MEEFEDRIDTVLRRTFKDHRRLVAARRLSGGASQETYRLDCETDAGSRKLAMRRAAGGMDSAAITGRPGLAVEAKLFRIASEAGIPAPSIHHVLAESDGLGPGFIMAWLDGETVGGRILRSPEFEGIRPKLALQCGEILARIHRVDLEETGLVADLKTVSTSNFVNELVRKYESYNTSMPMIDYTARWLLDHLPDEAATPRLVHNDFRNGNLMVTPEGVNAVLDWELAHIGDPIRDLGWICTNSWRFGNRKKIVGGFGDLEDLLDGYERESGIRVAPEHVHYWEVFGSFWWSIGCLEMAAGYRHGVDQTVERPGIARRSSECQVDCANLIIPGPVALLDASAPRSSVELPRTDELLTSVRDFLRNDARKSLEGRNAFLALVASNSLDIVLRELERAPAHLAAEEARLRSLLGGDESLEVLRAQLVQRIRDGRLALDHPGLADHLRSTVVNQLAIDQPKYSGLAAALAWPRA